MKGWALLLLAQLVGASLAPVIGIDAGNEYLKIAAIAPGHNLEMVLNTQSKRKTRSAVSFVGAVRTFGENAFAQQTMHPQHVVQFFSSNLGISADEIDTVRNKPNGFSHQFYPYNITTDDDKRGTIKMLVDPRDSTSLYMEDILAHFLNHAKDLIKSHLKDLSILQDSQEDLETTFTIPVYYRYRQRQLLRQSAQIAGLRTLGLIFEPIGSALSHALDLMDQPDQNATRYKIFLDAGSRNLQACLVQYSYVPASETSQAGIGKQTSRVKDILMVTSLGCSSPGSGDGKFGSHQLDAILADWVFKKSGEPILSERNWRRLLKEANKLKHTLSTNKEATASIGEETRISVSRDEFDGMLEKSGWLNGLKEVKHAMERFWQRTASSLPMQKGVASVELVGGGWRVPRVYAEIQNLFEPIPLGQKVNGDESMALGAAMMAANYSTTYKFRPLILTQTLDEHLDVKIHFENQQGTEEEIDISFEKGSRFGASRRRVIVPTSKPIKVVVKDESGSWLDVWTVEGLDIVEKIRDTAQLKFEKQQSLFLNLTKEFKEADPELIPVWNKLTEEESLAKQADTNVTLTVKLSPLGLVHIEKAIARWEELRAEEKDEKIHKQGSSTSTSTLPLETETSNTDEITNDEATQDEAIPPSEDSSPTSTTSTTTTPQRTKKIFTERKETRSKHLTSQPMDIVLKEMSTSDISQHRRPLPMSARQVRDARGSLKAYVKRDSEIEKLHEARNQLEALIYDERQQLQSNDIIHRVSSSDERSALLKSLQGDEDWLYEEGFNANLTTINKKMKEIDSRHSKMNAKALDVKLRDQTIDESLRDVKDMSGKIAQAQVSKPWLSNEQVDTVRQSLAEFENWFAATRDEQSKLEDTAESVLNKESIKHEWNKVTVSWQKLMKIRKPKVAATKQPLTNKQEL
eukprot:Gregarina_sp_Poly_1__8698@NODE_519_length_7749_cov_140_117548_g412_i0_p1_GENE_NODE_519_length_7749_cov_140_117548_g412_i0NODE_519_length_7749_cov_140_117548_g412_i0_p1_ORF_typecomplete_len918_score179_32HSP70/PF00012_20/1_7e42HSP70/PF00012_20/3_3e02MreB_Mbl/PF06723_13/0_00013Mucin/PF01456_17/2_1e03Mucin/PF01456_17/0_23Podoplanin/PF05808_11/10_NODE_519_length_7749_cov_140_117548_g412_i06673420